MILPPFEHVRVDRLDELSAAVADGATPYCGGTELLAAMAMGLLRPETLVSVRTTPELAGIAVADGVLAIGANETHRRIAASPLVRQEAPLLATVAKRVGNVRVRAAGTIGGNLAFAEPRSDVITVLAALDASVVVGADAPTRSIAAERFVRGPYETALRRGELIHRVDVPAGAANVAVYRKVVFSERPVVGVAVVRRAEDGRWRIAVGAVGEELYVVDVDDLDDAPTVDVADAVDVLPDGSGSVRYKRHLTHVTLERAYADARAGVPP